MSVHWCRFKAPGRARLALGDKEGRMLRIHNYMQGCTRLPSLSNRGTETGVRNQNEPGGKI